MAYILSDPIPALTTPAGIPSEGASTAGARYMWKDGSNVVHLLACFGGDAVGGWSAVYVNTNTNVSAIVAGATIGSTVNGAYSPTYNKFYCGTSYADNGSFIEFDPTTQTITKLKDQTVSTSFIVTNGDDNKIYTGLLDTHVYSYDPSVGMPTGWKDFGAIPNYTGSQISLGIDTSYMYCGYQKTGGNRTIYIVPLTGTFSNGSEWEFGTAGDKGINVFQNQTTYKWMATRTLSDDSQKFYWLHAGTYTEVTPAGNPSPEFEWDIGQGIPLQPSFPNGPLHSIAVSDESSYPLCLSLYGWDVDFKDLFPVKSIHEYSQVGYRLGGSGDFTYTPQLSYTGPWVTQQVANLLPLTGSTMFLASLWYTAGVKYNYSTATSDYQGVQMVGPYSAIKDAGGTIYVSGYSNRVYRYNSDAAWTLNSGNTDTHLPGTGEPNPYFITMPTPPVLNYRYGLDYDANGLIWGGGNTVNLTPNYGNVMWYDPTDGDTGYMFPGWAAAGTYFGSLCACLSRSKILVSDNKDNIYRIDAATQADDAVTINPIGSNSKSMMIETSNDRVFVITFYAGPTYRKGLLKPSDMTWVVSPTALGVGVSGAPFGFTDSEFNRPRWELILGPDNYVWMFVGNSLYRIDPTDPNLTFSKVADTTYGRLKFSPNGEDLLVYLIGNDVGLKYYQGILENKDYTREATSSLPADDADLSTAYTAQDVLDVATDDGVRVSQSAASQYAIHQFKNDATGRVSVNLNWNGQTNIPCSTSTTYLQIYNHLSGLWENKASDSVAPANTDFTLSASVSDLTNYKDADGIISCRVWQLAQ